MLTATEHIGGVGVGVTDPQYFRASDGKLYVVKLQNNKLGPKVLVSEYIAAKLGQIMQLCFPPSAIIGISEELLQKSPCLLEAGTTPGRHFASQYLSDTEYLVKDNINKASNITEMAGVILFDHMFHNADRSGNKRNLLLRREKQGCRIYAIDNSHLFRAGRWTAKALSKLSTNKRVYYYRQYGVLLKDCLSPHDFLPYLETLQQLDDNRIETIMSEIPGEWLPEETERQALIQYVRIRRNLAGDIWKKLCKYIPQERGGSKYLNSRVIRLGSRARTASCNPTL